MEFYKLFHKRTNYYSLLEWIDRGFRPDLYKLRDEKKKKLLLSLLMPFCVVSNALERLQE